MTPLPRSHLGIILRKILDYTFMVSASNPRHQSIEGWRMERFGECHKLPAPIGSGAGEKQFYCTNGILDCTKLVGLHAKIMPA